MARQRQIRLCREGVYYTIVLLAVLIGANSRQLNLLMLLGSLLAGPLLFSLFYGRLALRRIAIGRKLPTQLRADARLVVDISVANRRRWLGIWTIEVDDTVERQDDPQAAGMEVRVGVFFPLVGARDTKHICYEGRLPQRGRYRFGPLRVSTRFPLGLVRHTLTFEGRDSLLVHPKLGRLTHNWTEVMRENERGSQRMQRRGMLEADFYGLRDWRTGDSRHWIHWRTSARRGSLVVRQFEQRRSQDLALLVDLWQPENPSDDQLRRVETAVSFVATIIAEACRQPGRNLILHVAANRPLERSGMASPYFFREQMDSLALIAAHSDPQFPIALGHALALVPTATPAFLISTRGVDLDAFQVAAAERNAYLAGRPLQFIDVGGQELSRYFDE